MNNIWPKSHRAKQLFRIFFQKLSLEKAIRFHCTPFTTIQDATSHSVLQIRLLLRVSKIKSIQRSQLFLVHSLAFTLMGAYLLQLHGCSRRLGTASPVPRRAGCLDRGLWDLASPAGQRINFTALENKVVAVDVAWLMTDVVLSKGHLVWDDTQPFPSLPLLYVV